MYEGRYQVIEIRVVKTNTGYRFKTGWFGKQILQVSDICQSWDTNMGLDIGPEFVSWRNATKKEAGEFLKIEDCFKSEENNVAERDVVGRRTNPYFKQDRLIARPFLRPAIEENLKSINVTIKKSFKSVAELIDENDLDELKARWEHHLNVVLELSKLKDGVGRYLFYSSISDVDFVDLFNDLSKDVHTNAVDKGWWDGDCNDGELLMLIVTEVAEACEALRHNNPP